MAAVVVPGRVVWVGTVWVGKEVAVVGTVKVPGALVAVAVMAAMVVLLVDTLLLIGAAR